MDGRCVNDACRCPLPWAGAGCKARSQCSWWSGAWQHDQSCTLDASASSEAVAVCVCRLAGSYDVAVVQSTRRATGPFFSFNIQFQNVQAVLATVPDNPSILILVLTIDFLWLFAVIVSKVRLCRDCTERSHA